MFLYEPNRLQFGADLSFFVGHQFLGLSSSTVGHLVPFVLCCPSARQRGRKEERKGLLPSALRVIKKASSCSPIGA